MQGKCLVSYRNELCSLIEPTAFCTTGTNFLGLHKSHETFSLKDQRVNILGRAGHTVSAFVATKQPRTTHTRMSLEVFQ